MNEPSADWHPAAVTDYVVPSNGTPPPWKPPGSLPDPFGIVAGPDGNMWFTELLFSRIGRVTPDGHISQFTVTGGDQFMHPNPTSIVSGGDGALWFTAQTGLGRITTDGRITMYDTPSLTEGMNSKLAPAEDGVWVLSGRIGHVGRDGQLQWHERSNTTDQIASIFAGPDRQVWALTQSFIHVPNSHMGWMFEINKVLPDGSLRLASMFMLPSTPASGPPSISSIIAVSDGSFWIASSTGQSYAPFNMNIDQLSSIGRLERRAVLPGAYHIVEGPNDTVLVQGGDYIAKLDSSGTLSTYYPNGKRLLGGGLMNFSGVAVGPNGTIWITNPGGNGGIRKITP